MSVRLTDLRCTGCGAPLRFNPGAPIQTCPYCDAAIVATTDDGSLIQTEDWKSRAFRVKRRDFEQILLSWLADGDYTPDDILAKALVREHTGVYVPFYSHSGEFKAEWRAEAGFDREEDTWETDADGNDVRTTKTVTDWRRMDGEASDPYAVWVCASAKLPEARREWAEEYAEEGGELGAFDPRDLDGYALEDFDFDPEASMEKYGKDKIDHLVKARCEQRVPGDRHRSLSYTFDTRMEEHQRVYHPLWVAQFDYEGKRYSFVQDGVDADARDGDRPVDEERVAKAAALMRPFWIAFGVTAVLTLIGCLFGGVGAVPVVIIGGPITGFLWWRGSSARQELIDKSKEIRQRVLQRAKVGEGGSLGVSAQAVEAARNQVERERGEA